MTDIVLILGLVALALLAAWHLCRARTWDRVASRKQVKILLGLIEGLPDESSEADIAAEMHRVVAYLQSWGYASVGEDIKETVMDEHPKHQCMALKAYVDGFCHRTVPL